MNKKIITIVTTVTLTTIITMTFTFKNDVIQASSKYFNGNIRIGSGEETKSYPAGLRWTNPFPTYTKKDRKKDTVFFN